MREGKADPHKPPGAPPLPSVRALNPPTRGGRRTRNLRRAKGSALCTPGAQESLIIFLLLGMPQLIVRLLLWTPGRITYILLLFPREGTAGRAGWNPTPPASPETGNRIMSQAQQNIASGTVSDKGEADNAMAQAIKGATPRKPASGKGKGKQPQPAKDQARAPVRGSMGSRQTITLATAAAQAPTADQMARICRMFGTEAVDVDGIHSATSDSLMQQAEALRPNLSDKAMEMHFQRIVGAYVGSAYGAAQFYDAKRLVARDMASKLNEMRDEDRDGPSGFESRLERAQMFAADMAAQSFATLAAAEGAVAAYAEITGNEWKPYVANTPDTQAVSRQAATLRASAFD